MMPNWKRHLTIRLKNCSIRRVNLHVRYFLVSRIVTRHDTWCLLSVFAVAVQSYQEKEQALYVDLSTLIKDAAWLKHYIGSALKVQGDALLGASHALGESSQPDASLGGMSSMSLGSKEPSESGAPLREDSMHTAGRSTNPSSSNGVARTATNLTSSREVHDTVSGATSEGTTNPFLSSGVIPQ